MRAGGRILALAVAVILAGCTDSAGAPSPTMAPTGSGGRASPLVIVPSASPRAGRLDWAADSKAATDELMAAIGNPDTGTKSAAWNAFEAALSGGNAVEIRTTADVVGTHLDRARGLLSPYLMSADVGVGAREWDTMIVAIAEAVTRMGDGAIARSDAEVEAGRARMTDALRDHFYQGAYGVTADRWQIRWPWPDSRVVTPSRSRIGNEAGQAFDGQAETWWTAGDVPAPQWIEMDLGRLVTITGVRLLTYQPLTGETAHRVTVSGPSLPSRELASFAGTTADSQRLEFTAPKPIGGVQRVRVTTVANASLVGWREIEIVLAPESRLDACATGTTNLAVRRPVTASSSAPASKPEFAVDGDPTTRWQSTAPAPQSFELDLGRLASVGSVRLLPGGLPEAAIAVVVRGRDDAGRAMVLGVINRSTTGSSWLVVPGPTPCVGLRWITIESGWSAGPVSWREIQVLGTSIG